MVAYDERSGYRERLLKAEAELAEARAQIAAKDAALSAIVAQYAKRTFGGGIVAADEQYPWIAQAIRALATPAQEK
jgi:hypothetical protein